MFKRVPQPPVNPALRDIEAHDFWPGFVVAIIGLIVALAGARHMTRVETVDGGTAWESQLVKAFASAGLQYPSQVAPPPPPKMEGDPAAAAEALERWQRQRANTPPPSWKVRVDAGAKGGCPT